MYQRISHVREAPEGDLLVAQGAPDTMDVLGYGRCRVGGQVNTFSHEPIVTETRGCDSLRRLDFSAYLDAKGCIFQVGQFVAIERRTGEADTSLVEQNEVVFIRASRPVIQASQPARSLRAQSDRAHHR